MATNRPVRRLASSRRHMNKKSEEFMDCIEEEEGTRSKKKQQWLEGDRAVYEEQLEKLQEQLISTMLEKQMLQGERDKLSESVLKKEVDRLHRENKDLMKRLNRQTPARGAGGESPRSTDMAMERLSEAASIVTDSTQDGWERVSMDSITSSVTSSVTTSLNDRRRRGAVPALKDLFFDYVSDFTVDVKSPDSEPQDTPALTAKRLKDNLSRLAKSSKPVREFGTFVQDVLHWKNTAESLVAFLIYTYCVWNGWIFPLLLFIAITKLTVNYLSVSGLAEQFGFRLSNGVKESEYESLGLTDKFHLVKQVGQTVQNYSGLISDNLEKAQNLLLWRQPQATRQLYTFLWAFFILSLFLPNSYLLTAIGIGLGFKMFIIENIFSKYPKVKERHDGVAKLWASLPTNAQLEQRQSLSEEEMRRISYQSNPRSPSSDNSTDGGGGGGPCGSTSGTSGQLSEEEAAFCQRFQLSGDELPLPSWQDGKKCTSLDRDKPLVGSKGGKLYLTHSFLCFEKSSKSRDSGDRFIIPLADIVSICKAKPFAVLPGSGMAIELILKSTEKPVIFAALLHRDQALQSVLDQGLILGLPWSENVRSDVISKGLSSSSTVAMSDKSSAANSGGASKAEALPEDLDVL